MSPSRTGPVLVIADLHLSEALPVTDAAFGRFLREEASTASALYILGDLFEFWVGDDMLATPFAADVAARLAALSSRGVAIYVMHGNRDFLLGRRFAARAGATLLPDRHDLVAFGRRVRLLHGDTLCTDDVRYQRFRRLVHRPWLQRFFLAWPLRWRLALAARLRADSARSGAARVYLSDATPLGIDAERRVAPPVETIVHGHTHRPALHAHRAGHAVERWVLPDWELDMTPRRGGYLRIDAAGIKLCPLPEVDGDGAEMPLRGVAGDA
ncbi:UDP-2,3-diacylglucosamine diphosphatase [Chitinasiproducens palmae]|uniref:UDP-2,3-diacylglucosamine hydrolase n=1 Tax=Chitinasiproducens palmae TaxID=1770053 RepID=A0A1H2PRV2_9BURK|nr:UDP-2,3-diacylglucosamine diphosphatase [Chitinasiproducens palmae]SDV49661.1 UDP-2,3-diacylglucosamine hydrolase [Chitinasiproducens palmae]